MVYPNYDTNTIKWNDKLSKPKSILQYRVDHRKI